MSDQNIERTPINDSDLFAAINIALEALIEKKRKFTAYTVTTILRKKYPHIDIAHDRVQPIVRDTMYWSDEMQSGEWEKQDGVIFENAKGPARLYYPVDEPPVQEPVQPAKVDAPTQFESL